jgi:hypothetical protein
MERRLFAAIGAPDDLPIASPDRPRRQAMARSAVARMVEHMQAVDPNSRVKDLPDIALLAGAKALDAARLRAALEQTFSFRNTHALPTELPAPDPTWRIPYAAMARENRLAWPTLGDVTVVAKAFLDPSLGGAVRAAWDPGSWRGWSKSRAGRAPTGHQEDPGRATRSREELLDDGPYLPRDVDDAPRATSLCADMVLAIPLRHVHDLRQHSPLSRVRHASLHILGILGVGDAPDHDWGPTSAFPLAPFDAPRCLLALPSLPYFNLARATTIHRPHDLEFDGVLGDALLSNSICARERACVIGRCVHSG